MRHGMRDIKQERIRTVPLNKVDRMLGIPGREHWLFLRGYPLDLHFAVLPEMQRSVLVPLRILGMKLPHVVRVHQPARFIESACRWPRIRLISEMPLSEHSRSVTRALQNLRHGCEARVESASTGRMGTHNFRATRVAAAHQSRSGRRTDRLRHV